MESIKEVYNIGFGPSSSHTMGPQRAMEDFMNSYPNTATFKVTLYGSLALTGKGHLTDYIITKTVAPCAVEFIWKATEFLQDHPNTMDVVGYNQQKQHVGAIRYYSIGGGAIQRADEILSETRNLIYPHQTFDAIKAYCKTENITLLTYINQFDNHINEHLQEVWQTMLLAIARGIQNDDVLKGSLKIRRKAKKLYQTKNENLLLSAYAYAVNEENAAASGLVVTAPTCGACGTLPALLKFVQDKEKYSDAQIIEALKIAGLIGTLVKTNASISGAVAGCQAEVGTATSMAAAALAYLRKGSIETIEAAAEIAMEHQLGLTCDPVEGYVQIPCIQRNAIAAQKAYHACELAFEIGDIETVSFDTIVKVMYETGKDLPYAYRETSKGGLAIHYKNKLGPMC